jgi:hypothetical protein
MLTTIEYAILGEFLSDFNGSLETIDKVLEDESTIIWAPYQDWDLDILGEHIKSLVNCYKGE